MAMTADSMTAGQVQVFSQAARDNESTIVRLSFDTVEKIVREHFTVITETDVGVFADCVNCLTAFTNQSHDDSVALNAVAFLRFCAGRLAEGSIGDVDTLPEEVRSQVAWSSPKKSKFLQLGVPQNSRSFCSLVYPKKVEVSAAWSTPKQSKFLQLSKLLICFCACPPPPRTASSAADA
jgi:hypothetical protein